MVALNGNVCGQGHACCYDVRTPPQKKPGVADGTRTRNSQNHNLELYH